MTTLTDHTGLNDIFGHLISGYRPLTGIHDELIGPDGDVRAHWRPLLVALGSFHETELQQRLGFADRHLRDSGIVHRVYDTDGGTERPVPLSHVPLILDPDEWSTIVAATQQRATLLNLVLGDIYGDQNLVEAGMLPAAAIAGNLEFLRPLDGTRPQGGAFLRFYAMDVGRGPDGRWWVLADRTQAPSGAGYLLENRIALSRALPELYRNLNVRRLAGFFRAFRQSLYDLSKSSGHRVGLLTPGSFNETYFEHAYLARYLGLLLLQGEDLVVQEGELFVRTITGLQPIDVLLRRLDADFADPLELNSASRIGVPGLAEAVRNSTVAIVNALGSGVVEARVMMGFLPAISKHLLAEELILPHVATWWCGDDGVRASAMGNLDDKVVAPAFARKMPGLLDDGPQAVADMAPEQLQKLRDAIDERGMDFVVQETVHLSTMPVLEEGALVPRPFSFRVYATRTGDGWSVMPGGFCRISETMDARAVNLQAGGRVADVWLPSEGPADQDSLLSAASPAAIRRRNELLPAIAAENLFWLGRYVDRAENCIRLVRALATRLMEYGAHQDGVIGEIADLLIGVHSQITPADDYPGPEQTSLMPPSQIDGNFTIRALTDADSPGSVASLAVNAMRAGSVIRERLSPDAWQVLRDLFEYAKTPPPLHGGEAEAAQRCSELLRLISAFSGLAHHNMMRSAGWRFLQLGLRIERAIGSARAIRHLGATQRTPGAFEALLGVLDSQITFGTRYANVPLRSQVVDLLVLDPLNPRSLVFQAGRIEEHVRFVAGLGDQKTPLQSENDAIALAASLKTLDAEDVGDACLGDFISRTAGLADTIALDFFSHHRRIADGWRFD